MKFISKFDRYITAIYFVTIITIVTTSYFSFKAFFSADSQRQQAAITPLFSLITSEVISPLNIAQYMATDEFLIHYVQQENIEPKKLKKYLTKLSEKYNVISVIALKKHALKKQALIIDSSDEKTALPAIKKAWLQQLNQMDAPQVAYVNDASNKHLYLSVRLVDQDNVFLGFVGIAININSLSRVFNQFYQRFGYELYFVDQDDNITLSSQQLMLRKTLEPARKKEKLQSLNWYFPYIKQQESHYLATQTIVMPDSSQRIISQMPLKALNWRIFILALPSTEQSGYWQLFMRKLAIFVLVSFVLYAIFSFTINYFKSHLVKGSDTDYLTQLPNRSYIHWKYAQLRHQYDNICVVIADIDHFKIINDTHGHLMGDEVLKKVAKMLNSNLRHIDLTGRWGGEEFIMILPGTTAEQGQEVIDRIRIAITEVIFTSTSTNANFNITVSFGVCDSQLASLNLKDMIAKADQALYQAKSNGRNQVVLHLEAADIATST